MNSLRSSKGFFCKVSAKKPHWKLKMVAESNGDEKLEEQEENNVLVKFFRV